MILLDTDHLSVFTDERDPRQGLLNKRMQAVTEQVACTIVSVEEVLRGWLAIIHRLRDVHRQVPAYVRLGQLFNVLSDWEILPFDERAADQFAALYPLVGNIYPCWECFPPRRGQPEHGSLAAYGVERN